MSTRGRYIGPASRPVVPGHLAPFNPWAQPRAMYAALEAHNQLQVNSTPALFPTSPTGLQAALVLDFERSIQKVDGVISALGSALSFVRSGNATDSLLDGSSFIVAANVPRYGGGLGYLNESTRTNILLRSQDLSTAPWTSAGATVTADASMARDGTLTADTMTVAAAAGQGRYQVVTVAPSTQYTFSMDVRLGTLPLANATMGFRDDTAGAFIAVDVAINPVTNASGVTRTTYTLTTPAGCTLLRIYPLRSNSASPVAGSAHYSAMQLELGAYATSYIPTTTVAVTRNGDQMKVVGAPLTAAVGNGLTGYTMFAEYVGDPPASGLVLAGLANDLTPAFSDCSYLSTGSTGMSASILTTSVGQISYPAVAGRAAPLVNRVAVTVASGNVNLTVNGVSGIQDTSVTLPINMTRMVVGSAPWAISGNAAAVRIKKLAVWPSIMADGEREYITGTTAPW